MNITLTTPQALTGEQIRAWRQLQRENDSLDSPFFHPQFTRLVSEVRQDVEVAVWEQGGRPVGFFPFHRTRSNSAWPVGMVLSDFHGVLSNADAQWNVEQLVAASGLESWHFDHLVVAQRALRPYYWSVSDSPYMDLSFGFEHYRQQRREAGCSLITGTLRKARKLEREVGPVRLEVHAEQDWVFERLLAWKSDQRRRTGSFDVLQVDWVRELLQRLRHTRQDGFAGLLSALYAGPHLLAVHLGMRCDRTLHMWFPTYNRQFQKYSPGAVLFVRLAQEAGAMGIGRIDLGKGEEPHKWRYMSGARQVAEGSVTLGLASRMLATAWYLARDQLNAPWLGPPGRTPKRWLRQLYLSKLMR